jgi:MSHA biogenesis protein MshK
MDEALTLARAAKPASPLLPLVLLPLLLASAGAHAQAQALQDPTRPPAAALAAMAATAAPSAAAAAATGPRLQSILVAREAGGRHLAVIDGETVRLGEQFHGARVSRIGDNEVELVRGGERQVLRLYAEPAAGMTPVRTQNQAQTQAPVRR